MMVNAFPFSRLLRRTSRPLFVDIGIRECRSARAAVEVLATRMSEAWAGGGAVIAVAATPESESQSLSQATGEEN